jgi:hypothetical protein
LEVPVAFPVGLSGRLFVFLQLAKIQDRRRRGHQPQGGRAEESADKHGKDSRKGRFGTIVVGRRAHSDVEELIMGWVAIKQVHIADRMAIWIV